MGTNLTQQWHGVTGVPTENAVPGDNPGWKRRVQIHRFEAAQIHETVARSTVPVQHLAHLEEVVSARAGGLGPDAMADYTHSEKGRGTYGFVPTARIQTRYPLSQKLAGTGSSTRVSGSGRDHVNTMARSLIHELGHHVQNLPYLETNKSQGMTSATKRIRDEADAENYADKHYRPDKRFNTDVEPSGYDATLIEAKTGGTRYSKQFVKHYAPARNPGAPGLSAVREYQASRIKRTEPKNPGQLDLFHQEPVQGKLW
jgi:hypothetical protein